MDFLEDIKKEILKKSDSKKVIILQRFFKTAPGQYAEGDIFLGISAKEQKEIVRKYKDIELEQVEELLSSDIHEHRSIALGILVSQFKKLENKQKIYNSYLKNIKYINNWDLVDVSAYKIVGAYLIDKPKEILYQLAKSSSLWERRISIVSTYYFIKNNSFQDTVNIAEILLNDSHDLIHKATGWMLREVGKRDLKELEKFLIKNYEKMPRTMLRYAIEKFPESKRQKYLKGKI